MDIVAIQKIEKLLACQDFTSALQAALSGLQQNSSCTVHFILMLRALNKIGLNTSDLEITSAVKKAAENFIQARVDKGLENFTVWSLASMAHSKIMDLEHKHAEHRPLIDFLKKKTTLPNKKTKIIMLTCIWQRHDLTRIFFNYYKELKQQLSSNLDLQIIAVGSEGEISKTLCEQGDAIYIEHPNEPLTAKWQAGISALESYDFDALVIMGSDDFISKDVFDIYLEKIKNNSLFFGFQDLYIYDTKQKNLIYWYGYGVTGDKKSQPQRIGESIGLGRMLHRDLLEYLDFDLWKGFHANKSLDNMMKKRVIQKTAFLPVKEEDAPRLTFDNKSYSLGLILSSFKETSSLGVDVKHTINVTSLDSYCFSKENYIPVDVKTSHFTDLFNRIKLLDT
ncbi:hypothetical protein GCM10022421_19750 [Oceanisphaera sediminis]|uniref:Glycosyltransferase 2-like domain-containing protein n=1 Tax=Oceanisphaera sediminis TaxID=981381 RepID=A0ABP7E1P0_9GAMM